jgi:hypothetical protein
MAREPGINSVLQEAVSAKRGKEEKTLDKP